MLLMSIFRLDHAESDLIVRMYEARTRSPRAVQRPARLLFHELVAFANDNLRPGELLNLVISPVTYLPEEETYGSEDCFKADMVLLSQHTRADSGFGN